LPTNNDRVHQALEKLIALGCTVSWRREDGTRADGRTASGDTLSLVLAEFDGPESELAGVRELIDLNAGGVVDSRISVVTVAYFVALPRLEELSFHGSTIAADCIPLFCEMTQLKILVVGDTLLTWSEVEELAVRMPWCEVYWHASEPRIDPRSGRSGARS
jgi:hypothetical protein